MGLVSPCFPQSKSGRRDSANKKSCLRFPEDRTNVWKSCTAGNQLLTAWLGNSIEHRKPGTHKRLLLLGLQYHFFCESRIYRIYIAIVFGWEWRTTLALQCNKHMGGCRILTSIWTEILQMRACLMGPVFLAILCGVRSHMADWCKWNFQTTTASNNTIDIRRPYSIHSVPSSVNQHSTVTGHAHDNPWKVAGSWYLEAPHGSPRVRFGISSRHDGCHHGCRHGDSEGRPQSIFDLCCEPEKLVNCPCWRDRSCYIVNV